MNDKQLKELYKSVKTIASVGLSASVEKPSFGIAYYLKQQGYRIIPVNPTAKEIFGEKAYPDLLSIPEKVDVVQLFRRSEDVPPFVEQAIQIGAKVVWMQEGISNPEAAKKAEAAGLTVVMDRCMRAEHMRLFGSKLLGLFSG
jgi:uncharacterized protein